MKAINAMAIISVLSLGASSAFAVDKVWVDNANQNWTSSSNWNPGGMPGTFDTAIFNLGNVASPYLVSLINNQFQAINAVADRLRIDSNPITFTVAASTLTLDSANITETGRALVIGRSVAAPGVSNAVLENLLSQLNTTYATLGQDAGSSGTLNLNGGVFNVTGTNAVWDLIVGGNGAGTINVNAGADVSVAATTMLGLNAGSSGTITLNSANSIWTNTGNLHIGGSGGGTLTINAGQMSSPTGYVGYSAGSNATATITGPNSSWINSVGAIVGYFGSGEMTIADGAQVTGGTSGYAGYFADGIGTVTVSGSGSDWTNNLSTIIGSLGEGNLTISAGGLVSDQFGILGQQAGSIGNAVVTGANSKWQNSGNFWVGDLGNGSLEISSAGMVTCADVFIADDAETIGDVTINGGMLTSTGQALLANQAGASATVNMTGGTWHSDEAIVVGVGGDAMVNGTGCDITCQGLIIAEQAGSNGVVELNDAGVSCGYVSVGPAGHGELHLINNAGISANDGIGIGWGGGAGGTGVMTLDGDSGFIAIAGPRSDVFCIVGFGGPGTLEIRNGSSVTLAHTGLPAGAFNALVKIGGQGAVGTVIVDGRNSSLGAASLFSRIEVSAGSLLEVGNGGRVSSSRDTHIGGTLNVSSGGTVKNDYGLVGGLVTIDGATSKWENDVALVLAGDVALSNDALLQAPSITIHTLGELRGHGIAQGNVTCHGTLNPGNSIGTLSIQGNLSKSGTGQTLVEIASAANFDQLLVASTATLGGTLTVNLIEGFVPAAGQSFTIISADDVDGTFATVNAPAGLEIVYTATSVVLQVPELPCPADISNDGQVNVIDLLSVISVWGACPNPNNCPADINGDDQVNVIDLLAVINAWGMCP